MGNGQNESIGFTRGDAERLKEIEVKQDAGHAKLDLLYNKLDQFVSAHVGRHEELEKGIAANTRFRKYTVRALLWIFTTSTGLGLLAAGAKAMGWLH